MPNLFDRLQYNFTPVGNQVIQLSDSVVKTLNSMPKFLDDWQYEAMASNDLTGYTYNPLVNTMNIVVTAAYSIAVNSAGVVGLGNIANISNTMVFYGGPDPVENLSGARADTSNSVNRFLEHTNRLSGVAPFDPINSDLPHYDNAMSVGKSLMYIIYQSDGISNNAPIIGSFTSLFIGNTLIQIANTLYKHSGNIVNSISEITPPLPDLPYKISNLSAQQISTIENDLLNFNSNTFIARRVHDENFFKNAKQIMEDFNKMGRYKDTGETETNFLKNYIGTDKLKNKNEKFK